MTLTECKPVVLDSSDLARKTRAVDVVAFLLVVLALAVAIAVLGMEA